MSGKRLIVALCQHQQPECPKIFADESSEPAKQISITDDFGNTVQMSKDQFRVLVSQSRAGKLEV